MGQRNSHDSTATTYGGRPRMPLEDRAKIFVPFDPLAGFREALRQKEREVDAAHVEDWEKRRDAKGSDAKGSDV